MPGAHPVVPQGREECERLPMPCDAAQALSSLPPTMGADDVGLGPGLIDEDAVDGPRITGRASAKTSGNVVPKGTPGGRAPSMEQRYFSLAPQR
jgi:hypothetical protein